MNPADAETTAIYVETLSQGIIRILEVLYERSVHEELEDADYQLMQQLKDVFYSFFSSSVNAQEALEV